MKKYCLIVLVAFFCALTDAYSQKFDQKALEKTLGQAIKKSYAASVRMWGFDTVRKAQASAQFSGVVVNAEGYILTVSHAIQPNKTYKVFFPDGREAIAIALGKMGFQEMDNRPDLGMMKIITKGEWPFAEMGWSSSLKVNEPCLSISYPETLNQTLPTIRFGRITNVLDQWGFTESTCKMEPGDSGGPLFDYMGRVVALHSRIDQPEDINFEVPVDMYRKYWTALTVPEAYKALPATEEPVKADPLADGIKAIPGLAALTANFKESAMKVMGSTLMIKSTVNGEEKKALGTVFSAEGLSPKGNEVPMSKSGTALKGGSFLVGKSSVIGNSAEVDLGAGKTAKAEVLSRDKENDLVLLHITESLKNAIKLKTVKETDSLTFNDLGKFLISPLPGTDYKVSIAGSGYFNQPRKFSAGYFGASANFNDEKIILTRINPNSPAEEAKLALGDQITGFNNVAISRPEQYGGELIKYGPGDTVTIQGIRAGEKYNLISILKQRPQISNHPAERFDGGKSILLDGFKRVFSHDAALRPEECGSPVFSADGVFYGINIARFSRTSTLAIPAMEVKKFIEDALSQKLVL
ncbi:PDZ domain-containing protein [Pedobacter metabolipauper]|uniref:Serine protease Do n=1 Tax=Pedobacter metabolipauper TaxID=425513 RepID=A0A4R6SP02_9SPHI|nr:PDZ domain-containing protein [Pedobacter metabolipauper]TDQ06311.1 serine protease Do [Pedobacter metabolipauper]